MSSKLTFEKNRESGFNKCPCCGSVRVEPLTFPEGAPICKLSGCVQLIACADCGTISLSAEDKKRMVNNYAAKEYREGKA